MPGVPSAPTLYRLTALMDQGHTLVDKATALAAPFLMVRDGKPIDAIKHAKTIEALLDLAPEARGAAESAWHERVRRLGIGAAPIIAQRLQATAMIADQNNRDIVQERLVAALRWQGDAGARALRDCFDSLNVYGQSLACVAWGLLRDQASAGRVWEFFETTKRQPESHFVGALWALIDLKDARASKALSELLTAGRVFYELYGFLALAGDEHTVVPLMKWMARLPQKREAENEDAVMALIAIARRISREAMLREMAAFEQLAPPAPKPKEREAIVEKFMTYPRQSVEDYFQLFYRGLSVDDFAKALR